MAKICIAKMGDRVIADKIAVAGSFLSRLKGLMWKKDLTAGEGLLLTPCKSIHTFGMNFDIDALFLSRDGKVLHLINYMKPNKISPFVKACESVLELKAGTLIENGVSVGDIINVGRR